MARKMAGEESGRGCSVGRQLIRTADPADAVAVAAIYAHHVLHGTASFDTIPPDADKWRARIAGITARGWPFLVVEDGGAVVGYAYATQFRDRPAYAETCENSIYIAPAHAGRGLGSALMEALLPAAANAGFRQMIAVVGGGESASVALHEKFGFVVAGRMRNVGRKFGHLLDTVYLQRALNGDTIA
jgi:phosphinothricin acetyltransferase